MLKFLTFTALVAATGFLVAGLIGIRPATGNLLPKDGKGYARYVKAKVADVRASSPRALVTGASATTAKALRTRNVQTFFCGVIGTLVIALLLRNKPALKFLSTLEHELTHGIAAVMTGGSFKGMTVTAENGGHAQITNVNFMVRVAPYCLPLFSLGCLCLLPFLQHQVKMAGVLAAGLAYGNYLLGNFPSIGIQPDIRESGGKWVAYPVVCVSNVAVLIGIILFLVR